ncbi:hypothetical protein PNOK_0561500 [Pyrrhoderma noxium]|uniref:Uncharacterized protein n=1 Tax=Pyrrhoderma noxium TaxID=2282107 RepID=A0A286UGM1_9AGAM|nr:hypothetical protein PNOK_0561500 [Pyrrhoderma noxium]
MLWIGPTDESQENAQRAPEKGNLCRDWACAMAPLPNTTSCAATSLCYSAASDFSQPMAQRLARKFKKQIFLSVDLPPTFISMGYGPQLALEVEKRLVETLKEIVAR